jgi:hypothetical protein
MTDYPEIQLEKTVPLRSFSLAYLPKTGLVLVNADVARMNSGMMQIPVHSSTAISRREKLPERNGLFASTENSKKMDWRERPTSRSDTAVSANDQFSARFIAHAESALKALLARAFSDRVLRSPIALCKPSVAGSARKLAQ